MSFLFHISNRHRTKPWKTKERKKKNGILVHLDLKTERLTEEAMVISLANNDPLCPQQIGNQGSLDLITVVPALSTDNDFTMYSDLRIERGEFSNSFESAAPVLFTYLAFNIEVA